MKINKKQIIQLLLIISSLYIVVYFIDFFSRYEYFKIYNIFFPFPIMDSFYFYLTLFNTLIALAFYVFFKYKKEKGIDLFRSFLVLLSVFHFFFFMLNLFNFLKILVVYQGILFSFSLFFYLLLFLVSSFVIMQNKDHNKKGILGFVLN